MVVQHRGPLVEAARMPGIAESQPVEIEVMTELVAERAEESAERRYLFAYRGLSPDANHQSTGMIVPEKLRDRAFPHAQRSRGQHPDATRRHTVEGRCGSEKIPTGTLNIPGCAILHGQFNHTSTRGQPIIGRQGEHAV